jgi:NAD(P)-dependent dehydrogenase (short-subunit alcohol dehydrogenase family)
MARYDFAGKVAVVTGGAQGIGDGIVRKLLGDGMSVAVGDADAEALDEASGVFSASGRWLGVRTDVAREDDVRALMRTAVARFGRIDALINNAGIGGFPAPLEETTLAAWERVMAVNLTGAFLCAREAAPELRRRNGAMVNIASTRALQSEPGTFAYSASKGGVVALTHALAVSLGPAVRVNAICPGWIEVGDCRKTSARRPVAHRTADRAQHPAGRVGTPADIAELAAYLIAPESGFVTGQAFAVDGGMTIKMIYEPDP